MRRAIRVVSVERMLAFTPLPNPSENTSVTESGPAENSTLSPQSSSPILLICFRPNS